MTMAQIFISYSRVDRPFVDNFLPLLHEVYGYSSIWFDAELHGGQVWWDEILSQIARCDIFVFLMSNESLASTYCLAELAEARRLGKLILPVQIRARTTIPDDLTTIHYVDLSQGVGDVRGMNRFHAAVRRLLQQMPDQPPAPARAEPITMPVVPASEKSGAAKKSARGLILVGVVGAALLVIIVLVLSDMLPIFQQQPANETESPTNEVVDTPTIDIALVVATLDAQGTAAVRATSIIGTMTQSAVDEQATQTHLMGLTVTATRWTPTPVPTHTPTPDMTASITALTEQAVADMATALMRDRTATAAAWTDIPTRTQTATRTPTPTRTPSRTPRPTERDDSDVESYSASERMATFAAMQDEDSDDPDNKVVDPPRPPSFGG